MEKVLIEVCAGYTKEAVLEDRSDVVFRFSQTVREAKRRARYYLTDGYKLRTAHAEPLVYSQVRVDGKCVADFNRK
jgi:hypothetical protein